MTDTSYIAGKTVVMTGKFAKMTRKEAQKAVEELGATIGKSVSGSIDLLIYGDKAGSKLQRAQSLGVETRNEDWLVALLAGEDPDAAEEVALEGPLADYLERVEALAKQFEDDPRIASAFYRPPGVSSVTLERVAKDWEVEELPADIANFYRQANGLYFIWFPIHHSEWDASTRYKIPRGRFPTSYELESLPVHIGGVIWILPIEEALKKSGSHVSFAYGSITGERNFWGGAFQGEEVERSLRLLEYGHYFYPVAFLTHPAFLKDFPVVMGSDYGAAWEDSYFSTFEGYLEDLLAGLGTPQTRRRLSHGYGHGAVDWIGRMEPIDFESLLPKAPEVEKSDTFEVTVANVTEVERTNLRGQAMLANIRTAKSTGAKAAKALGIDHSTLTLEELFLEIAKETESLKDVDMKIVKKLAPLFNSHKKTKTELTEKLWCDIAEVGQIVEIHSKTLFSASKQDKYRAESDANNVASRFAASAGLEVLASTIESTSGRKTREAVIKLYCAGTVDLEVGKSVLFDFCPSGFVEFNGAYMWKG